jgi:hypothetical protein
MALIEIALCGNVEKDVYKMYTEILFHCSNINTDCLLSSNRIKLEKQQM